MGCCLLFPLLSIFYFPRLHLQPLESCLPMEATNNSLSSDSISAQATNQHTQLSSLCTTGRSEGKDGPAAVSKDHSSVGEGGGRLGCGRREGRGQIQPDDQEQLTAGNIGDIREMGRAALMHPLSPQGLCKALVL